MITLFSALLLLTSLFNGAATQTSPSLVSNEEEVEQTIIEFFDAMRESNGNAMKSLLTQDATLHTVVEMVNISQDDESVSGELEFLLRENNIEEFITNVGNSEPGSLDEQLTSFTTHVDGGLSTAWMNYSFYYNGEFTHCGVNTMNLIRTENGWKIFSIVDTRRREGCGA